MVRRSWVSFQCRASYNLDYSRAKACCACNRCGWGVDWTFLLSSIFSLLYLFSPLSPSLWETARYRLKYFLKGPLNPKQPTNPPTKQSQRKQLCFRYGALDQVYGWGQGFGLCFLLYLVAYSSYVFEWMEPSDGRLILFLTSLHYIDTLLT